MIAEAWRKERLAMEMRKERLAMEMRDDLINALTGAYHALRSYQYGNGSKELAKETADYIDAFLKAEMRREDIRPCDTLKTKFTRQIQDANAMRNTRVSFAELSSRSLRDLLSECGIPTPEPLFMGVTLRTDEDLPYGVLRLK